MRIRMSDLICREYSDRLCVSFAYPLVINDTGNGRKVEIRLYFKRNEKLGISDTWDIFVYLPEFFVANDEVYSDTIVMEKENCPLEKVAERGLFYFQNWIKLRVQQLQKIDFEIGDILGTLM